MEKLNWVSGENGEVTASLENGVLVTVQRWVNSFTGLNHWYASYNGKTVVSGDADNFDDAKIDAGIKASNVAQVFEVTLNGDTFDFDCGEMVSAYDAFQMIAEEFHTEDFAMKRATQ